MRITFRNVVIEPPSPGSAPQMLPRTFSKLTTQPCPVCGKRSELILATDDVREWIAGMPIQTAMPYLKDYEREALISGVCSDECWSTLWSDTADDDTLLEHNFKESQ